MFQIFFLNARILTTPCQGIPVAHKQIFMFMFIFFFFFYDLDLRTPDTFFMSCLELERRFGEVLLEAFFVALLVRGHPFASRLL